MAKRILLVEDDPFLIDIYTTKLREAGFEVQVAEDGEKALTLAESLKPDLVVLDIVLPNLDGWEVLRQLKTKKLSTKVVILSNLGQKDEVEKGLSLGAIKYFIKANYTPTEIVEEIKKLLK